MKKHRFVVIIITLLALFAYYFTDFEVGSLNSEVINSYVQDQGDIELFFCPHEDCEDALVGFLDSASESIDCALFDVGLESVQQVLLDKSKQIDVRVVTDNDYLHKFDYGFVREDSWGLMHNKFCVVDRVRVSTGSMNPTNNGAHKNNNNLLLISSDMLASSYTTEFEEMWGGVFKKGSKSLGSAIQLGDVGIEQYFCPDDGCALKVKEKLGQAQESIHFMTFSFTHQGIADVILLKNLDGLEIRGVMEARQVSKYSRYAQFAYQEMDVIKDGNKNNMHHKSFVIDKKCVITGSMNPSAGGDTRNDENVIIICDEGIANRFIEEFERVYAEAKSAQQ
jgi:phosphatidylserine/phosphatidylglycerophosphate/cardiolipin synthase-like enzyme